MKIDPNDLITQAEAARIRGVSHEAIRHLVREGRFKVIRVGGKPFVLRSEIKAYRPGVGGRPPKKKAAKGAVKSRVSPRKSNSN